MLSIVNRYVGLLTLLRASSQHVTLTGCLSPADAVIIVEFKTPDVAVVVVLPVAGLPIVILQSSAVSRLSLTVQLTFKDVELWFVLFTGNETVIVGAVVSAKTCTL